MSEYKKIMRDRSASERRINSYIAFLMDAYGVDAHGLADLAGIPRQTLTKFIRAPYGEKGVETLVRLARVTGMPLAWLFGEVA